MLACLYHSYLGRCLLKLLIWPPVSELAGNFLDSRASRWLIGPFLRRNHIDLSEFQEEHYGCFNDFFVRRIRPECRPIDRAEEAFIAPCDGLLQVFPVDGRQLTVKGIPYSLEELLESSELAKAFAGGTCFVFRLTPTHYHRYAYPDDGCKEENVHIPGVFHTVQPIAVSSVPVFARNSREYTLLHTAHFGDVLYMEVGAMLVGRICNLHGTHSFRRGEEKGRFEFGGSTIILLTKPGAVTLPDALWAASRQDQETPVRLGQKLN